MEKRGIQKKKLIHHVKVIYINTVFEDYVSAESAYIRVWFCVANDDETKSTFSQIAEQFEVIQKQLYQELS